MTIDLKYEHSDVEPNETINRFVTRLAKSRLYKFMDSSKGHMQINLETDGLDWQTSMLCTSQNYFVKATGKKDDIYSSIVEAINNVKRKLTKKPEGDNYYYS